MSRAYSKQGMQDTLPCGHCACDAQVLEMDRDRILMIADELGPLLGDSSTVVPESVVVHYLLEVPTRMLKA